MATIDTLDIKISAEVVKASKSIDELCTKLNTLSTSLGRINGSAITGLANGVNKLSNAMQGMKNVKTADFTRLATNIEKLGKINTSNLNTVASSMNQIGRGLNAIGNVANLQSVTPAINAIKNLARVDMSGFDVSKLNAMGNALSSFANKMSSVNNINSNVVRLVSSLATLAKSGQYIGNVTTELPRLGTALVSLANNLSSASSIDSSISATIEAIARLANTGEKAAATVSNLDALGNGVVRLLQRLQSAPQLNSNIATTIQGLGNIAANGSRATRSLNAMSTSMTNATKKTKGLASAFGMFYAKMFLVIRGIKKLWSAIESSMDYIEVLNYFDAAFEQVSSNADLSAFQELGYASAEEYANSFQERTEELTEKMTGFTVSSSGTLQSTGQQSLGMNPSETMNYQAMFAQMSSSMGVASDTATKMSQALTQIGADLASVKNLDYADVWEDMASGLAGMSRTLDKYGVNIRNVNLQQKLNELGIEANITALNQNEKALLRTIILLDSTQYAWGDLADTINQPANQLRLITANFKMLGQTIGNLFLPMVQKVLPYINGLVIALQRLFTWLGNILGIDISGITSAVGNTDYSDLLSDTEDLADNLEDAASAAEEYKNQMLGFDEATKLTDSTSSSSSSSTSGLDDLGSALLDEAFNESLANYQAVWDRAFENMDNKAQAIADDIEKAFEPLKNIVVDFSVGDYFKAGKDTSELITSIMDFFHEAIMKVDWAEIGHNIGEFLSGVNWAEIIKDALRFKIDIAVILAEVWFSSFEEAPIETALVTAFAAMKFTKVGQTVAKKILKAIKKKLIAVLGLSGNFSSIPAVIGAGITSAITEVGGIGALLTTDIRTIVGAGSTKLIGLTIATGIIGGITSAIVGWNFGNWLYEKITGDIADYSFFDLFKLSLDDWKIGIEETVDDWKTGIDTIGNYISYGVDSWKIGISIFEDTASSVINNFSNSWKIGIGIIEDEVEEFIDDWETGCGEIKDFFKNAKTNIQNTWTTVSTWFSNNVINPIKNFFGNALTNITTFFSNAKANVQISWMNVNAWFSNNVISPVKSSFSNLSTNIVSFFSNTWSSINTGVTNMATNVKTVISNCWSFIQKLFNKGGKIFDGVVGAISNTFKTIVNSLINGINKVIAIPFNKINDLLNSIRDVTILSVKPFSGLWDKNPLPVPQIPTFKTGGFPEDGLFMANQGELVGKFSNGKTAVANNEQITQGIATAVYNAIRSANATNSNNQQVIKVYVGTKELEDIMIDGINKRTISTGTSPLLI